MGQAQEVIYARIQSEYKGIHAAHSAIAALQAADYHFKADRTLEASIKAAHLAAFGCGQHLADRFPNLKALIYGTDMSVLHMAATCVGLFEEDADDLCSRM